MAIQITAPDSPPDNEIIQTFFQGKDQQRVPEVVQNSFKKFLHVGNEEIHSRGHVDC